MSIFLLISIGLVTDVPRQMSLYRFPGFILLSCLFIEIIVTEIEPYLYIQNKIICICCCNRKVPSSIPAGGKDFP